MILGIVVLLVLIISGSVLAISLSGGGDLGKQLKLGEKYLAEGKYEEAILAFEKAIKIDEKNIDARIGLAKAYVATDKLEKAEEVLQDAIGINPVKPEPYIELANVYILEGKTDEAIKILEQGYENTQDENIKKLLEEISANPEGASDIIMQYIRPIETLKVKSDKSKKEIVTFEDKEFEKYVREKIKKDTGDIYSTDLQIIEYIFLNHENSSVSGEMSDEDLLIDRINMKSYIDLRNFPNLGSIHITDLKVELKDIHLKELKNLHTLALERTQTTDISALNGLDNIEILYIEECPINDISVLNSLKNLQIVWLNNIKIKDINALRGLANHKRLKEIHLRNNEISDISALKGLINLEELSLEDNQISDISALQGLTKLEELRLGDNQIYDISALRGLTKLDHLSLYNNQISDISALKGLTNLTYLEIHYNPIKNFSPIDGISKLDKNCIDTINRMKQGEYLGRRGE